MICPHLPTAGAQRADPKALPLGRCMLRRSTAWAALPRGKEEPHLPPHPARGPGARRTPATRHACCHPGPRSGTPGLDAAPRRPRPLQQRAPRRTCAPPAAAPRPSPPRPPLPAVSSSWDTTPEPSLGGEAALGLHRGSLGTSMPLARLPSQPTRARMPERGSGRSGAKVAIGGN